MVASCFAGFPLCFLFRHSPQIKWCAGLNAHCSKGEEQTSHCAWKQNGHRLKKNLPSRSSVPRVDVAVAALAALRNLPEQQFVPALRGGLLTPSAEGKPVEPHQGEPVAELLLLPDRVAVRAVLAQPHKGESYSCACTPNSNLGRCASASLRRMQQKPQRDPSRSRLSWVLWLGPTKLSSATFMEVIKMH